MSNESNTTGGSFAGLLFLVFLTLKLTHYIDWSWWWVCAPLWVPFAIFVAVAIVLFVVACCRD